MDFKPCICHKLPHFSIWFTFMVHVVRFKELFVSIRLKNFMGNVMTLGCFMLMMKRARCFLMLGVKWGDSVIKEGRVHLCPCCLVNSLWLIGFHQPAPEIQRKSALLELLEYYFGLTLENIHKTWISEAHCSFVYSQSEVALKSHH